MSAERQWRDTCERQARERAHMARALAPSTCKRAPRKSTLARFVAWLLSL